MKHSVTAFVLLIAALTSYAGEFVPTLVETTNFKLKDSRAFPNPGEPRVCKFETRFNEKKGVIELRMGIVGSAVDHFGWNMSLSNNEFPLQKGFEKMFAVPGNTTMILTYDGENLVFAMKKGSPVWNRLYPFSLKVDAELLNPVKFKGTLEGYETNAFGKLVKHVVQECTF